MTEREERHRRGGTGVDAPSDLYPIHSGAQWGSVGLYGALWKHSETPVRGSLTLATTWLPTAHTCSRTPAAGPRQIWSELRLN